MAAGECNLPVFNVQSKLIRVLEQSDSREDRHLMRQRGAGPRDLKNVSFGFNFEAFSPAKASPIKQCQSAIPCSLASPTPTYPRQQADFSAHEPPLKRQKKNANDRKGKDSITSSYTGIIPDQRNTSRTVRPPIEDPITIEDSIVIQDKKKPSRLTSNKPTNAKVTRRKGARNDNKDATTHEPLQEIKNGESKNARRKPVKGERSIPAINPNEIEDGLHFRTSSKPAPSKAYKSQQLTRKRHDEQLELSFSSNLPTTKRNEINNNDPNDDSDELGCDMPQVRTTKSKSKNIAATTKRKIDVPDEIEPNESAKARAKSKAKSRRVDSYLKTEPSANTTENHADHYIPSSHQAVPGEPDIKIKAQPRQKAAPAKNKPIKPVVQRKILQNREGDWEKEDWFEASIPVSLAQQGTLGGKKFRF